MTDTKQPLDEAALARNVMYGRYVTVESIDLLAERVTDLLKSGRRMTLVEHIDESSVAYKVTTGLVVDESARRPIEYRPGQSFHVALSYDDGRGWAGLGFHVGHMHPTRDAVSEAFARDNAWRIHEAKKIEDALQRALAIERIDRWSYLTPGVRDVTHVTIYGGSRFGSSREDSVTVRHMNEHGVPCSLHLVFDNDYLRMPVRPPYREGADPDGDWAAELITDKAPASTRWALLRDLLDRHPDAPASMWNELADLDVAARPWAHDAAAGESA